MSDFNALGDAGRAGGVVESESGVFFARSGKVVPLVCSS